MTEANRKHRSFAICTLVALTLSACIDNSEEIEVVQQGDTLDVFGAIDARTVHILRDAKAAAPEVTTLRLVNIPGSLDDEASLTGLAAFVKEEKLAIVVPSDGIVASGGTDMAVMSLDRVIENGACVGVHSWGGGGVFGSTSGADAPRDDPQHQLYLDFYKTVDVPEELYWFTLEAAGPDGIHWMSPEEINRFNLSNVPLDETISETARERRLRCDQR